MASEYIKALRGPPSVADAEKRTLDFLNASFKTHEDLESSADFDELVESSRLHSEELDAKVRAMACNLCVRSMFDVLVIAQLSQSQADLNDLIVRTRATAQEHLHNAQELSLLRHSLADELSYLSTELVSTLSGPEGKPTLLEDIETLHRSLKELQSVKGYIQVIEHALMVKCVPSRLLCVLTTAQSYILGKQPWQPLNLRLLLIRFPTTRSCKSLSHLSQTSVHRHKMRRGRRSCTSCLRWRTFWTLRGPR